MIVQILMAGGIGHGLPAGHLAFCLFLNYMCHIIMFCKSPDSVKVNSLFQFSLLFRHEQIYFIVY